MDFPLYVAILSALVAVVASSGTSHHNDGDASRSLDQNQMVGQVVALELIDAETDLPVATLENGLIIDLATQNTTKFNIKATTDSGIVESIRFSYNALDNFRVESQRPFAFCGDDNGNYRPCSNLAVGQHTVSATSYSGASQTGTVGNTRTVTFTIVMRCEVPRFVEPIWQSFKPDYPVDTTEPMGLLIGNDVVSFSGFINSFRDVINQTFARDVTTVNSAWRRMDDMPLPVAITHAAAALVGMKVYLCGGYLGAHPGPHTPLCYIYDHSKTPGTGRQWTRFADLPNNGTAGAGMVYDSKRSTLYYVGGGQRLVRGSPQATDVNNTWKYDFRQPSYGWVATTAIPYKANHLSAVTVKLLNREQHFFVGGQISENEVTGNFADVFEFFPSNETYVRRTSMPFARGHTTTSTRAIGCGFIVAGGSSNSVSGRKNRTNNIMYYNVPTNIWTSIGEIPKALATPLVDIHPNGYMYYINCKDTSRRMIVA